MLMERQQGDVTDTINDWYRYEHQFGARCRDAFVAAYREQHFSFHHEQKTSHGTPDDDSCSCWNSPDRYLTIS